MGERELRIVVSDFDRVHSIVRLHDKKRELSDILVPLGAITSWRYEGDNNVRVRLQVFMRHIKKQGGKQTILDMVDKLRTSRYEEPDYVG